MSKEYNDIDDLFRDKFDDYEVDPPDYIWDNVKSRIGNPNGNGNGKGSGLTRGGISGIVLLLISLGVILFYLLNSHFVVSEVSTEVGMIEPASADPILFADNAAENNPTASLPATGPAPEILPATPGPDQDNDKTAEKKERPTRIRAGNSKRNSALFINPDLTEELPAGKAARRPLTVQALSAGPVVFARPVEKVSITGTSAPGMPQKSGIEEPKALHENPPTMPDMVRGKQTAHADAPKPSGIKSDYGSDGRWLFGLYFTPELIVYPHDDQLKNYSYSLDLHASYRLGAYFLQSGVGFSRNHDQGNSTIDYNKYMGSYEDVFDVTFDTAGNGIIPVYHTETVHVYDSISHVVINPTKRYFTYLQVPFFVGYGEESRRFGWFVKGGPSLSFLIHEQMPASGMDALEARILNIENELPGRITTNWQFIVSAGVTYKLGPGMSLSMEPMFRYYIKSAYEQGVLNTKHPFSAGLRTGLLLSF